MSLQYLLVVSMSTRIHSYYIHHHDAMLAKCWPYNLNIWFVWIGSTTTAVVYNWKSSKPN